MLRAAIHLLLCTIVAARRSCVSYPERPACGEVFSVDCEPNSTSIELKLLHYTSTCRDCYIEHSSDVAIYPNGRTSWWQELLSCTRGGKVSFKIGCGKDQKNEVPFNTDLCFGVVPPPVAPPTCFNESVSSGTAVLDSFLKGSCFAFSCDSGSKVSIKLAELLPKQSIPSEEQVVKVGESSESAESNPLAVIRVGMTVDITCSSRREFVLAFPRSSGAKATLVLNGGGSSSSTWPAVFILLGATFTAVVMAVVLVMRRKHAKGDPEAFPIAAEPALNKKQASVNPATIPIFFGGVLRGN